MSNYFITYFTSLKDAGAVLAEAVKGENVFGILGLVFNFFVDCFEFFRELYHGIIEFIAQLLLTNALEFVLRVPEQDFPESFATILRVTLELIEGFITTLDVFAFTLLGALPLGLIICFGSMSKFKPLKWLTKTFVWIIRGTPLMLQLIVIFYGPGLIAEGAGEFLKSDFMLNFTANYSSIAGVISNVITWVATWENFERFMAVMIAFIINYSCYFSEIYRGGIESIPKGQYEACQVLGMSKTQTFFKVVLMQVVKRIVPPMSNEIITLVKDTSLARIISVYEIIWNAQAFIKSDGLLWPLFYTAVFYLVFNGLLTVLFGKIEKKLNYYHN